MKSGNGRVYFALALIFSLVLVASAPAGAIEVLSDKVVKGFSHPESVAYDPTGKFLYVSEFGSELKPTLKDGKGRISKLSMQGKVVEKQFVPKHGEVLNKPKGIWIENDLLWVTDIDSVWLYDLKTRDGKKVDLPGAKFANDPVVIGGTLYVSDTGGDQIFMIEPADFSKTDSAPEVTSLFKGLGRMPNGLYPNGDAIVVVGYDFNGKNMGVYVMSPKGIDMRLADNLGQLDGVARLDDGSLLITDWKSGSLFLWTPKKGKQVLAQGFGGPADFCVIPEKDSLLVVVPDLVKSELRFIRLSLKKS